MPKICVDCKLDIKSDNFCKCAYCKQACHELCDNLSPRKSFSEPAPVWACPSCISKRPKGDNTKTPVRHNLKSTRSSPNWVLQRSRGNRFGTSPVASEYETPSLYPTVDEVRDIIQSEYKNILMKELTILIEKKIASELRETVSDIACL
ncbi:unnamed protein product [Parnassius mnemosyne]|uniref:PHD-type domain-containing protein n=1 Tax=Parnassius mnemosyne TaxID=213953 RepID=A0AAV1L347_9NEOP